MNDPYRTTDIADLHADLAAGKISIADLAEWTIARSEELNPRYNFWVTQNPEDLRAQAREAQNALRGLPRLRLLEGMPTGVKDVFNTASYPTQMGSPLWKDFTPGNDARVVFNCRAAGGLIGGKTVTAEFAVHAEPGTINPHDETRTPGTSSSGSAVAVALGIVPVALGTQTGASITRPASFCGIYGFKPSFGLLPRTGVLKTTDSLDTIGFFTARCNDLRRVFNALRVQGMDYPISHKALSDAARQNKPTTRPWRILFAKTHTWPLATEDARALLLAYIEKLEASGEVEIVEAELPAGLERCHELHATIYDKCLSYYFKDESREEMLISKALNEMIASGKAINLQQFQAAVTAQERLCCSMDAFLSGFDATISLSTGESAPALEASPVPDPGLMWTMLHLPSISAPCLRTAKGMPLGVQFAARRFNDLLLLNFVERLRELELVPPGPAPLARP